MVIPISQQIRQQMTELEQQVNNLERGVNTAGDNDQLCHIEEIRESFNNTRELARTVYGIGQDIITDLKDLKLRIKVLEAQRDSLSLEDTFQRPASPLQDRVQGSPDTNNSFHIKISNLYRHREAMLIELLSQGTDLHQAADQIESAFKGRITNLSNKATTPEQSEQVNEFLNRNEELHCRYFEEQTQNVMASFTGNNEANFYALLPLVSPLNEFISKRDFVIEENKQRMRNERENLFFNLDTLIGLQQVAENGVQEAQESIAAIMQLELDALKMSLTEPAVNTVEEDDLEFAAALKLSEQQPAEPAQDDDSLALAMSLLGGIGDSIVANQSHSRELLERQTMMVEFLIPLQNAHAAGDLNGAQEAIATIDAIDSGKMMDTFSHLQTSLHRQMNKNNHGEYPAAYGRQAFLGELPAQMEQATKAERAEVISRALAMTLLTGIKEAVLCGDNVSLRNQLDQLKALNLNKNLPGYKDAIDLENAVCEHLKELHATAGFDGAANENNPDFARLALRNSQGFSIPDGLKLAALEQLEEELHMLWMI